MRVVAALALAAASAAVVAPVPSYDPWMWLLWGREVAGGELSTAEGPAFKPLTVAACVLLAPLGNAAPEAWVVLARAGAFLAVLLAYGLGRDLARGSRAAGAAAAAGVLLCGSYLTLAATGAETGWTVALALAAFGLWRDGRIGAALACGVACALLRVEAWPFLLVAGAVAWRRARAAPAVVSGSAAPRRGRRGGGASRRLTARAPLRTGLVLAAVAVPVLWFVPEWIGSGDPLRSGSRAREPEPGQPALADVPLLAALEEALALPLLPLWLGALAAPRAARPLLIAGLAWILLVAAMAQAGFSGEARYALPGAALVSVAGAAGLAALVRAAAPRARVVVARYAPARGRRPARRGLQRALAGLAALALLAAAAPRLADLPELRDAQAHQDALATDLDALVTARGRDALLACGRPYTGRLRGPLVAYHLDVEKERVGFEPAPPGSAFRSALREGDPVEPATPPAFTARQRLGTWELRQAC